MKTDSIDRILPVAIGAGLAATGAVLWYARPDVLATPEAQPLPDKANAGKLVSVAQKARDKVAVIASDNVGVTLGRSLLLSGLAMILVRILDEITARQTR